MADDNDAQTPWSVADQWPAGWYPDPWDARRHRLWTGTSWTARTTAGASVPGLPPVANAAEHPVVDGRNLDWTMPPTPSPWPTLGPDPTPEPILKRRWIAMLATLAVVAFVAGFGAVYVASHDDAGAPAALAPPPATVAPPPSTAPALVPPPATTPAAPPTTAPTPTAPVDPFAGVINDVILRGSDASGLDAVILTPGGDSVEGAPTLDLCNGTFPSDAKRTARRQVALVDPTLIGHLSTEGVLYDKGASVTEAFEELRTIAGRCPNTPVTSPVGEATVTTVFNPAPDSAWPRVSGVDRITFDFTTTDATGNKSRHVAVYLRRGRLLLGIYFFDPTGPQEPVAGQTTIPGIVHLFEERVAAVPAAAVVDP